MYTVKIYNLVNKNTTPITVQGNWLILMLFKIAYAVYKTYGAKDIKYEASDGPYEVIVSKNSKSILGIDINEKELLEDMLPSQA